jgi:hypothetical protein
MEELTGQQRYLVTHEKIINEAEDHCEAWKKNKQNRKKKQTKEITPETWKHIVTTKKNKQVEKKRSAERTNKMSFNQEEEAPGKSRKARKFEYKAAQRAAADKSAPTKAVLANGDTTTEEKKSKKNNRNREKKRKGESANSSTLATRRRGRKPDHNLFVENERRDISTPLSESNAKPYRTLPEFPLNLTNSNKMTSNSSTLETWDRSKPHLTNIPTEIRLNIYRMAIEDRNINAFQQSPSERDNLKDETFGNLSLAYPTLEREIEDWLESAPHLQRSLR